MNLNQYADRIISILKKTPTDSNHSIWDVFCNDDKMNVSKFNNYYTKQFDKIFNDDISKISQEGIIYLWECTVDGDIHENSYFGKPSEYEGDIILDIKNELIELLMIDINH